MPRADFQTLQDFADRQCDLRLWCYACQRAAVIPIERAIEMFAARGWSPVLDSNRPRFRCQCRSRDVLLLPARWPKSELDGKTWNGASPIEWAFHTMRKARKDEARREERAEILAKAPPKPDPYERALRRQLREKRRRELFPRLWLARIHPRLR
jgi:hypothetical protein